LNVIDLEDQLELLFGVFRFRAKTQYPWLPSNAGVTASTLPILVKKRERAMKPAELTGEVVVFDQGRGQSDTISLAAFFTKENHKERTLPVFYVKKMLCDS
jgi:hypothetical protein